MEISRNDPCHCGSGKKFKKCCLSLNEPSQDEFKRRRLAVVAKGLIGKIMQHIVKEYGPESIDEAFEQFHLYQINTGYNKNSNELQLFMPWFFYEWLPHKNPRILPTAPTMAPALSLAETDRSLSSDEKNYLLESCFTSFSFFEVTDVDLGKSIELKDILTEEQHIVLEKRATENIVRGDILFGKVIIADGIGILEACAPVIFKPIDKIKILDLKKRINRRNKIITQHIIHSYAVEVLQLYRYLYELTTNPPKPIVVNTDGELLVPHKLIFEIENADDVFDQLYDLCLAETKEELLERTKRDRQGKIRLIDFNWAKKGNKKHKTWENTVLGSIKIEQNKMTVETNSAARSKKFQTELKKRMQTGWKLKSTVIEDINSMLENSRSTKSELLQAEKESNELMQIPELQQRMKDMMKSHWDSWLTQPLPALNGATPTNAAKTKLGREKLNALLTQFERNAKTELPPGLDPNTFKNIRVKLKLSHMNDY